MRDLHLLAQELSAAAERARFQGNLEKARSLFGEAAELEHDGLLALPPDRPKSRGILALSWVALLFKAGLYDRAEPAICSFLKSNFSAGPIRAQLRELLQIVREERLVQMEGLSALDARLLDIELQED